MRSLFLGRKNCRGKKVEGKKVFNGEVWDAERAKKLGLIDDIGTMEDVLESKYGQDVKYKYVNKKKSIFSRFSSSIIDELFSKIIENKYFSKFGL